MDAFYNNRPPLTEAHFLLSLLVRCCIFPRRPPRRKRPRLLPGRTAASSWLIFLPLRVPEMCVLAFHSHLYQAKSTRLNVNRFCCVGNFGYAHHWPPPHILLSRASFRVKG